MDFTRLLNRIPKYVATRTLEGPLAWAGSTVLEGELAEAVTGLRERYDQVHVIGSLNLVQSLLGQGLVDRLHLWVYPVPARQRQARVRGRRGAFGTAADPVARLPEGVAPARIRVGR